MLILPAIDLYEQKAVRLYQGDYSRMEVYSDDPAALAAQFEAAGAQELHMSISRARRTGRRRTLRSWRRLCGRQT